MEIQPVDSSRFVSVVWSSVLPNTPERMLWAHKRRVRDIIGEAKRYYRQICYRASEDMDEASHPDVAHEIADVARCKIDTSRERLNEEIV